MAFVGWFVMNSASTTALRVSGFRHRPLLHDAVCTAREGEQKHDVNQRRVVCNDELPRSAKSLDAVKFVRETAQLIHHADEEPQTQPQDRPRPHALHFARRRRESDQGQEPCADDRGADAEHEKADGRYDKAPIERIAPLGDVGAGEVGAGAHRSSGLGKF